MSATSTPSQFELVKPGDGFASTGDSASTDVARFHRWVLAALLFHAALLTGLVSAAPRQIGDASGFDGAISVSLVTESELRGDATVEDHAAGAPAPPEQLRPAIPPELHERPAPEPPEDARHDDSPQERTPPSQPREAEPEPGKQSAAPPQLEAQPRPESAQPEAAPLPAPALRDSVLPTPEDTRSPDEVKSTIFAGTHEQAPEMKKTKADTAVKPKSQPPDAKPLDAKPPHSKPKKTETAKLDLGMPKAFRPPPGSRGAGFERPAGITRSGENDAFARGVIRALQATMPQLRETRGRVRVRITLNRNGNLVSTKVEMPSNVPGLDQSVVFATKQTSFPLPPYNANDADLVFIVTYIYE